MSRQGRTRRSRGETPLIIVEHGGVTESSNPRVTSWTEERKQAHSARMKAMWAKKKKENPDYKHGFERMTPEVRRKTQEDGWAAAAEAGKQKRLAREKALKEVTERLVKEEAEKEVTEREKEYDVLAALGEAAPISIMRTLWKPSDRLSELDKFSIQLDCATGTSPSRVAKKYGLSLSQIQTVRKQELKLTSKGVSDALRTTTFRFLDTVHKTMDSLSDEDINNATPGQKLDLVSTLADKLLAITKHQDGTQDPTGGTLVSYENRVELEESIQRRLMNLNLIDEAIIEEDDHTVIENAEGKVLEKGEEQWKEEGGQMNLFRDPEDRKEEEKQKRLDDWQKKYAAMSQFPPRTEIGPLGGRKMSPEEAAHWHNRKTDKYKKDRRRRVKGFHLGKEMEGLDKHDSELDEEMIEDRLEDEETSEG